MEAKRNGLRLVIVVNSTDSGRIDDASLLKLETEIFLEISERKLEEEVLFKAERFKKRFK